MVINVNIIPNSLYRTDYILLNETNYDLNPSMFSSFVTPNWGLVLNGVPGPGIQECATYNPPGPTQPRSRNNVS